ncbi:MAG TPA: ABC transporter permease [Chloroflexota bacterium]|nr:ABC transporter permease [Chloroflexota bacterium]HUM68712.1 ABC transporter permease [Chloroflexota bacterium]
MSGLRRIAILLQRELVRGPRNTFFLFAILMPFFITLVISLLFGTFFVDKPRLGVMDEGDSQVVVLAQEVESLVVKEYDTAVALRTAVENGAVDLGIILPADFDAAVRRGEEAELTAYVWGESLLKDRTILGINLAALIRQAAGQEAPVNIITRTLGDVEAIPWEDRVFPLIILMTIIIGATMVPATSLVNEKQKRTLSAINVTPTTLGELFAAKALVGILLSVTTAVVVLLLNRAFGEEPVLLLFVLLMGAMAASLFGILLGAFVKDITTLFAVIKGIGILLYAPAFVYLFPTIPQWVAQIFPTYYIVQPVIEIVQQGATLPDIAPELAILSLIILAEVGAIGYVIRNSYRYEMVVA